MNGPIVDYNITLEEAWAGLPKGARPNGRAVALAAHYQGCVECHNTDMRARCPIRSQIVEVVGAV